MKVCKQCELKESLTEYNLDSSTKDGYSDVCNECKSIAFYFEGLKHKKHYMAYGGRVAIKELQKTLFDEFMNTKDGLRKDELFTTLKVLGVIEQVKE